jgi:hypothetical protein
VNKIVLFSSSLLASALLGGCVGTGPNTQQGAVTGGAIGALAGAIIGNNSVGGDALGGAILGGTVGALAGGALGNSVDHERGTVYGYPAYSGYPAGRGYRTSRLEAAPPPPPPTPVDTIPAAPTADAVWVPGYWIYGGRYSWMSGHWEIPPPYARSYVAGHWENQGGRDVYVRSYWQ